MVLRRHAPILRRQHWVLRRHVLLRMASLWRQGSFPSFPRKTIATFRAASGNRCGAKRSSPAFARQRRRNAATRMTLARTRLASLRAAAAEGRRNKKYTGENAMPIALDGPASWRVAPSTTAVSLSTIHRGEHGAFPAKLKLIASVQTIKSRTRTRTGLVMARRTRLASLRAAAAEERRNTKYTGKNTKPAFARQQDAEQSG